MFWVLLALSIVVIVEPSRSQDQRSIFQENSTRAIQQDARVFKAAEAVQECLGIANKPPQEGRQVFCCSCSTLLDNSFHWSLSSRHRNEYVADGTAALPLPDGALRDPAG